MGATFKLAMAINNGGRKNVPVKNKMLRNTNIHLPVLLCHLSDHLLVLAILLKFLPFFLLCFIHFGKKKNIIPVNDMKMVISPRMSVNSFPGNPNISPE